MLELALLTAALAAFALLLASVVLIRRAADERERTRQWLAKARATLIASTIQPRDNNSR